MKNFKDIKNSELMRSLEVSNWNNDGSRLHVFNNKEELECYLLRDKELWDEAGQYDFEQCDFNFEINSWFWITEFKSPAIFKLAHFNHKVSFKGLTFCENADFNWCTFSESVDFSETVFEKMFWSCSFDNEVSFASVKFKQAVDFWGKGFLKAANFKAAVFEQGVSFADSIFYEEFFFHNTRILKGGISFEDVEFKKKVNAWNITCKGDFDFQWANFRDKVNLSQLTVSGGNANFHGTNFEENAYFYESHIKELDLSKSVIDKGVYFLDANIKKANRETYRIIKHEFIKQNNRVEALNYHSKEMYAFLGERLTLKNAWNKILLTLNLISNGFGLWWWLGLIFIMFTGFLFYSWLINNWNILSENWRVGYLQFILPTHSINDLFPKGYNIRSCHYTIDILGRVFIGFGIYQTIQAFRKYGRF